MEKFTKQEVLELSSAVEKLAFDSSTRFNESTPAASTEQLEGDQAAIAEQSVAPTGQDAVPATNNQEEPEQQEAVEPTGGPESIGAKAAQQFLGVDIMQAAMTGDPAAADLVSRTAGQVAGAVTEAMARTGGQSQMSSGMEPGGEGMQQAGPPAPPAMATPEEDLANEIVPQTQPSVVPPNGQPPAAVPNGQPVDNGQQGQPQGQPQEQPEGNDKNSPGKKFPPQKQSEKRNGQY